MAHPLCKPGQHRAGQALIYIIGEDKIGQVNAAHLFMSSTTQRKNKTTMAANSNNGIILGKSSISWLSKFTSASCRRVITTTEILTKFYRHFYKTIQLKCI
ncbi:hypothetical protein DXT94_19250 [Rhizobium sp. ICMP 5592]|nr:hypothetical protein [Rhizobium sp. ICMP 5592]